MNTILSKLLNRASDLADVEPVIALFLGAALLAVFLTVLFRNKPAAESDGKSPSLIWTLYRNLTRLVWAVLLVLCWPLALLVLIAWPFLWLLSIPFRIVGAVMEALLALLRTLLFLPARLLGYREQKT